MSNSLSDLISWPVRRCGARTPGRGYEYRRRLGRNAGAGVDREKVHAPAAVGKTLTRVNLTGPALQEGTPPDPSLLRLNWHPEEGLVRD